jgi:hypothetical protein
MLAEKFLLILETIISHRSSDGAPRVVSKGPFVPMTASSSTGAAGARNSTELDRPLRRVISLRPD